MATFNSAVVPTYLGLLALWLLIFFPPHPYMDGKNRVPGNEGYKSKESILVSTDHSQGGRRQGVPGRLPGRGGPELRLEDGLGETRKGVSAEGRACSKSWRQDEPVPLQTVVCVCASLQEGGYMCVYMCVCVHLCGCAHTRVSHKITSGRFTELAGGS